MSGSKWRATRRRRRKEEEEEEEQQKQEGVNLSLNNEKEQLLLLLQPEGTTRVCTGVGRVSTFAPALRPLPGVKVVTVIKKNLKSFKN
jgi:hypothetical protein